MKKQDIYEIAAAFRSAILEAKFNSEFDFRDRMSNFPGSCCDDSCDLLAHYLYTVYDIHTKQGNGVYRDSNPYNTTNHAWLLMDDDIVIDITADQFKFFSKYTEGIYVGEENTFYKHLECRRIDDNYAIMQNARLWNDYQIIVSGIVK